MQLQLHWQHPQTQVEYTPTLTPPIAFGRDFAALPASWDGQTVSRMVLDHDSVATYHAILEAIDGQLRISDRGSSTGTRVNGVPLPYQTVVAGDVIQIGAFSITVVQLLATATEEASPAAAAATVDNPQSRGTAAATVAGFAGGSTNSAFNAAGICTRQVGFLIKRPCGRTSTEGCPHCRNGQVPINQDPYVDDYNLYPGYGEYGRNYWGYHYYSNRDRYYYDPDTRQVDFTEADAASFEEEADQDYEMDLDAS